MADKSEAAAYIAGLVERAKKAQAEIEFATQEEVDELCKKIAFSGTRQEWTTELCNFCVEEGKLGHAPHKVLKMDTKIKGTLRDTIGVKTCGLVEHDKEKGIMKFAKPMGVIGGVIPCTNPEATPFCKAISAIKTRNAIIMAPHPRTKVTNEKCTNRMRAVLKKAGYPEDLIITIAPDKLSLEATNELMKQCDFVIATGGGGLVEAAYSSGTPAQGVGAGNAVVIVDETCDMKEVANMIMRSKTFDNATSCSTENALVVHESVYDELFEAMKKEGGYLCNEDEKARLLKAMWPNYPNDHVLSAKIVAQPFTAIAAEASIDAPADKKFFIVEETGVGEEHIFSREKLSVTTTVYKYKEFSDAIDKINEITTYCGPGHSCGIHTTDVERIKELGEKIKTSRVMVRQPQCLANSGAWTNGMPMTMTLGCGTWGGNAASENITFKHMLNYTWVSEPIADTKPTEEDLFGNLTEKDVL
ncbi:MAG: aldehyde dehydrogenase family protein [Desulfobacterales bacterium]|nr:aldehyde dehydrogenase family protein [Desulfobacterales bacterium]